VLPEPARLLVVSAPQSSPAGTVSARATVPLKPFSPDTEIVAVADLVVYTPLGDVAVIEKSCCLKSKVAVVECTSERFAPVMVRVYVDAVEELHDTVAVPEPVRLLGVIAEQVNPDGTASVRVTVPSKPSCPIMVIVELADCPGLKPLSEDAEIVKSGLG